MQHIADEVWSAVTFPDRADPFIVIHQPQHFVDMFAYKRSEEHQTRSRAETRAPLAEARHMIVGSKAEVRLLAANVTPPAATAAECRDIRERLGRVHLARTPQRVRSHTQGGIVDGRHFRRGNAVDTGGVLNVSASLFKREITILVEYQGNQTSHMRGGHAGSVFINNLLVAA